MIKVIYQVTIGKSGCVFSTVHLVLSISNVGPELYRLSTCGLKADLACKGYLFRGPFFHLSNGILKDTLLGLGRWEEDDERNTGHIGKKKKKTLYKFSWQERVGSFISRTPSLSSLQGP